MEKKDNKKIYIIIKNVYDPASDEWTEHKCIMAFTDYDIAVCMMEYLKSKRSDRDTFYGIEDVELCNIEVDWEALYE